MNFLRLQSRQVQIHVPFGANICSTLLLCHVGVEECAQKLLKLLVELLVTIHGFALAAAYTKRARRRPPKEKKA